MNKYTYNIYLIRCVLTIACFTIYSELSFAQFDKEIISIGERELSVGKVLKIAEQPKTIDSTFVFQELIYQILPRRIFSGFQPENLKPAKINVKPKAPKLYKAYAKTGIGTNTTPLLELYYNSLRTRKGAFGFRYNHLSSNGGVKDAAHSGFSDNSLDLWGKAFLNKHVVDGNFGWRRDVNHFYGFDPGDEEIEKNEIKQLFNEFHGGVRLGTYHRDSTKISYSGGLKGFYLANTMGDFSFPVNSKETHIEIDVLVNKREGDYVFEIGGDIITNKYEADNNRAFSYLEEPLILVPDFSEEYVILNAKPRIKAETGDLDVTVGLDINYENNLEGELRFFPQLHASYKLFDGLVVPFVEYTGGIDPLSYNEIRKENPFILNNIPLLNQNNRFVLNGGVRGRFNEQLSFTGQVSVQRFKQMPIFINDTIWSNENRFDIVYDDGRSLGISGQLVYKQNDDLNIIASLDLIDYNMDDFKKAWHRPNSKITIGAIYDYHNKLVSRFDLYVIGKRPVKSLTLIEGVEADEDGSYETSVKGYADASLSFEYRYTKRLSAFLQFNNITGGKYQRWYNYRTQPFQILGGITYSF